jgi:hypothetical protein
LLGGISLGIEQNENGNKRKNCFQTKQPWKRSERNEAANTTENAQSGNNADIPACPQRAAKQKDARWYANEV